MKKIVLAVMLLTSFCVVMGVVLKHAGLAVEKTHAKQMAVTPPKPTNRLGRLEALGLSVFADTNGVKTTKITVEYTDLDKLYYVNKVHPIINGKRGYEEKSKLNKTVVRNAVLVQVEWDRITVSDFIGKLRGTGYRVSDMHELVSFKGQARSRFPQVNPIIGDMDYRTLAGAAYWIMMDRDMAISNLRGASDSSYPNYDKMWKILLIEE